MRILLGSNFVNVRTFGWLPDKKDEMDSEHNALNSYISDAPILSDVDNRQYFQEVSDQLSLSSCTANAGVDAFEAGLVKSWVDNGYALAAAKALVGNLSRMFVWYWARSFMVPSQVSNAGSGCYNRHVMEVLARFGAPPEHTWPYDTKIIAPYGKVRAVTRPSIRAQKEAQRFKTDRFFNIPSGNKSKLITGVDKALSSGHNVIWGTMVGSSIAKYQGGVAGVPSDYRGGHSMVLCGKLGDAYWCRNSWGPKWGQGGYCLVSKEYVTWKESSSFWFIVPEVS